MVWCRLNTNLFLACAKSIIYLASGVNVVSFNLYVGPWPRIKISLFLSSICTDDFISAPKIMAFSPCLSICKWKFGERIKSYAVVAIFVII